MKMKMAAGAVACALLSNAAHAGANRIADLNPGAVGSYPSNLTVFAGSLYFSAYTLRTGRELWKFDGTGVALAADINDTADDLGGGVREGNDSVPDWLTVFHGALYFSAFDPRRGGELWRYDGNSASRVSDINPDVNDAIKPAPNNSWPQELTIVNDALYFSANSSTTRENYELWKYDGAKVSQVFNIHPDLGTNHSSYPKELTAFNGALFFSANDGANGYELWTHDGVNTNPLNINPGGPESSSFPKFLTPFNTQLLFQAHDDAHGFELWKSDGATVTLAADIDPGPGSSYPEYLTPYKGAIYFRAADPSNGAELWKYDGTQFMIAANINENGNAFPKNLTVLGDILCFAADDGVHGWELWKYDGANASLVADLNPSGDSFPEQFIVINNVLYFTATTPETGYEIWKYDGNSVSLAADVNPGPGSSFPFYLSAFNGQLVFSAADDGFSNWELWTLTDAPVNSPPAVSLTAPENGASFLTADAITFSAAASDDGGVERVEFLANGATLGTDSSAPYSITAALPAGAYTITARATDISGANATSSPITITVSSPPEPGDIRIISAQPRGSDLQVTWQAAAGTTVYVQGTDSMPGVFQDVSGPIVTPSTGEGTFTEMGAFLPSGARFYRVTSR